MIAMLRWSLTRPVTSEPIVLSRKENFVIEKKVEAKHPIAAEGLNAIPGNRDAFTTILESVTQSISRPAKETGLTGAPLLDAVTAVVTVAAGDAVERGGDMTPATKAIIMGVVRGTGATGDAALKTLSHAARIIIHRTADRSGNVAAAIKGVVLGAIASARTMAVETSKAASTAAQGALEGASEAGSVTVETVRIALKEPIGGNKVVLPDPLAT
jgi:hypothetical protein